MENAEQCLHPKLISGYLLNNKIIPNENCLNSGIKIRHLITNFPQNNLFNEWMLIRKSHENILNKCYSLYNPQQYGFCKWRSTVHVISWPWNWHYGSFPCKTNYAHVCMHSSVFFGLEKVLNRVWCPSCFCITSQQTSKVKSGYIKSHQLPKMK